jgi:hypothetical protein
MGGPECHARCRVAAGFPRPDLRNRRRRSFTPFSKEDHVRKSTTGPSGLGRVKAAGVAAWIGLVVAAAGIATGQAPGAPSMRLAAQPIAESGSDTGTPLASGLKIFSGPDQGSRQLGTTTSAVMPLCQATGTGGTFIAVTGPSLPGLGYVAPTGTANGPAALPKCDSIPGTIATTVTTANACPQYDYQCEQRQVDQKCLLTQQLADQQQQADLERRYQELLFKALSDMAAMKTGSALLQQWVNKHNGSGNKTASPQDIAELIKESALTPLDMAQAAAQALKDLDEETHRYVGTTCTGGKQDSSTSSGINKSEDSPPAEDGGKSFATNSEGDAYGKATWANVDLTPAEKKAVEDYSMNGYTKVNGYLRGKTFDPPLAPAEIARIKQNIADIDSALLKKPTPEEIQVVRMADPEEFQQPINQLQGTTQEQPGYMSTTLSPNPKLAGGKEIKLHLDVPADTPALYLGDRLGNPGENELLLARGLKYKIESVRPGFLSTQWDVFGKIIR